MRLSVPFANWLQRRGRRRFARRYVPCDFAKTLQRLEERTLLAAVEGIVFQDLNGSGVRQSDSPGLAGWTVFLDTNPNGHFDASDVSTTTDAQGRYQFENLTAGDYSVFAVTQSGWFQTTPFDGAAHVLVLESDENSVGINFGAYESNSIVIWTGAANNNDWNTASNWNLARVPTASDDVFIRGISHLDINLGSHVSIHSLHSTRRIYVDRDRSLTMESASQIDATLTLANRSTQSLDQELVVGELQMLGATLSGQGVLRVSSTLVLNGANRDSPDEAATNLTDQLIGRTLILETAANGTWQRGHIQLDQGALFENRGSLELKDDSSLGGAGPGTTGTFRNLASAIFRKTGGTAFNGGGIGDHLRTEIDGEVSVSAGTLKIGGGGTSGARFRAEESCGLVFKDFTLTSTANVFAQGNLTFEASNRNAKNIISGTITVGGLLNVSGGTSDFQGPVNTVATMGSTTSKASLRISGWANFHSQNLDLTTLTLAANDDTRLTAGTVKTNDFHWQEGVLDGPGTMTVTRRLAIEPAPGLTREDADKRTRTLDGRTLKLFEGASGVWTSGNVAFLSGAKWMNAGSLIMDGDWGWVGQGSGSLTNIMEEFENIGTFIKRSGAGNSGTDDVRVTNSGVFSVENGHFAVRGGGVGSGSFQSTNIGKLIFRDYTLTHDATVIADGDLTFGASNRDAKNIIGGTITVGGLLEVLGGTSDFQGQVDLTGASLYVERATANFGEQDLVLKQLTLTDNNQTRISARNITTEIFNWRGGVLAGSGSTTVTKTLTFNAIYTQEPLVIEDQELMLLEGATTQWINGSLQLTHGAAVTNAGEFNVLSGGDMTSDNVGDPEVFRNLTSGTFRISPRTSDPRTGLGFSGVDFANEGTVEVQSGSLELRGEANVLGGTFAAAAGATLTVVGGATPLTFNVGGSGTVKFEGTATMLGEVHVSGEIQITGRADFQGPVSTISTQGSMTTTASLWIGGWANFHSQNLDLTTLTLAANGDTRLTAGTVTTNDFHWQAGVLDGPSTTTITRRLAIEPAPGLTREDADKRTRTLDGRTLKLSEGASGVWTSGNVAFLSGAKWTNAGSLIMDGDWGWVGQGSGSLNNISEEFENTGTFTKRSGAGNSGTDDVRVTNSGMFSVESGHFAVRGGGVGSGSFQSTNSGKLIFRDYTLTQDATVIADGDLAFEASNRDAKNIIGGTITVGGLLEVIGGTSDFQGSVNTVATQGSMTTTASLWIGGWANFHSQNLDLTTLTLTANDDTRLTAGTVTTKDFHWQEGVLDGLGTTTVTRRLAIEPAPGLPREGADGKPRTLGGRILKLAEGASGEWISGNVTFLNGAKWTNAGSLIMDGDWGWLGEGNGRLNNISEEFENTGTFTKRSGAGNSGTDDVRVTNSGMFSVESGHFAVRGGGLGSGSFRSTSTGKLIFRDYTLTQAATVIADGDLAFEASNRDAKNIIGGTITVGGLLEVIGGTSDFQGPVSTVATMGSTTTKASLWVGGWANFHSQNLDLTTLTLAANDDTRLTAGTVTTKDFHWQEGVLDGLGTTTVTRRLAIEPAPGLPREGADGKPRTLGGRNLMLAEDASGDWTSGNVSFVNGAKWTNAGSLIMDGDWSWLGVGSGILNNISEEFENIGTFTKRSGIGFSGTEDVFVTNQGVMTIETGKFALRGGGSYSGELTVKIGSTVRLGGDQTFLSASKIQGGGDLEVDGAIVFAGHYLLSGQTSGRGQIEFTETATVDLGTIGATWTEPRFNISAMDFGNAQFLVRFAPDLVIGEQTIFPLISVTSPFDGTPRFVTESGPLAVQESERFTLGGRDVLVTFEGGDGNDMVLVPLEAELDLGTLEFVATGNSPIKTGIGTVDAASDKDLFRFRTPDVALGSQQRLEIQVELKQPDGSLLDPHVRVFQVMADGTLLRVAFDDDSGAGRDALATFYAQANEEYVIVAGGFASTTGAYRLEVSVTGLVVDDYPNFFNSARSVSGLAPIAASIEMSGDQDFLEVTAGHTGLLDITQSIVIRQPSDAGIRNVLFVFDSRQRLLGFNEGAGTTKVRVNVRENDRLIIRSSLGENRTGDYRLTFSNPNPNDDLPNSFREARNASLGSSALVFDALGGARLSGTIEVLADLDLVSFVSSVTGRFTALLRADTNSQLDPVITVFDALRNVLVANDDIRPNDSVDRNGNILIRANRNSFVTFDVSQGARYYVQAAGFGIDDFHRPGGQSSPTGRYVLELAIVIPDDVPDVVTEATSIMLNEFGTGGIARILNDDADLDVFEVVASNSGDMTVTLSPRTMSFTGSLSVLDERLIQIAQSESLNQPGPLTLVVSNVVAGQKFFVRVGGSATTSAGAQGETNVNYQLTLATHESQNNAVPLVDSKTGLELEHELVNGLARALETFAAADARTGLGAVLEANPLPNVTVETRVTVHRGGEVARSTNANIVSRFLTTQGGQSNLDEPVFLVWIDPLSFLTSAITKVDVRNVGQSIDNGTVNETQRGYYSGDGVTQLLILSAAALQRFEVQLVGFGGSFRVGINYITRESISTVTIQDSLYKDDVRLVYDFSTSTPTPTKTATQVIPRTLSTSFASSDQATDSPSFLAQASASLMVAASAAAKANANNPENGDGSSSGESLSTDLGNTADSEDSNANNSANSNSTKQAAARDALNSLLAIFSSNETDIAQMPGGAVIQQVVNFFRQMIGQPTPPASGTKTSPPNNPAKPGTSTNSPNGTSPSSNAKPTSDSKANNQTVSQASDRLPGSNNSSRSRQRRAIAKVRSENAPGQSEYLATHSALSAAVRDRKTSLPQ